MLDRIVDRGSPVAANRCASMVKIYGDKSHRCDDRIVSISQPHVRPIVGGKQSKPVEFGQGTNGYYRLNYIRAKRADTSAAWINSIFLVMDLLILLRIFFVLLN